MGKAAELTITPPSGCPTDEEIKGAYDRVALHKAFVDEEGETVDSPRAMVQMFDIALKGISIVSRLMESLDGAVKSAEVSPTLEFPKDIPIFTFTHESRLLTECYKFPLPDGTAATMMQCARGAECMGMHKQLEGHEESGGITLRALLTPEELTAFEHTGKNPQGPRLCVMCARVCVSEAYFETQDARYENVVRGTCFNFYGNLRGCREGYKMEHTIPLGTEPRWNGLIAPVACNSLSRMRIKKHMGVWTVDQSELGHVDIETIPEISQSAARLFR